MTPTARPASRPVRAAACALLAGALALAAWGGMHAGVMANLQLRASDALHPRGAAAPDVVVVGIDDRSIQEVGLPWPWPRDLHARLVDRLTAAGARAIALDVLYAPPAAGDDALAAAVDRAGTVVLAETVQVGGRSAHGVLTADLVSPPSDAVADAADASAHVAVLPDRADGVVRRVPLVVDDGRALVPALAFTTAALVASDGQPVGPPIVRADGVQLGSRSVPTEGEAAMTISYAPELSAVTSERVVAAVDVLEGRVGADVLDGAVVFVGATDPTLGDHLLTPVAKQGGLPGVLVHANAYSTIATRAYLAPEPIARSVLSVLVVALAAALAVQLLRLWLAPLAVAGIAAAFVAQGFWMGGRGTVVDLVYPGAALLAAVPASLAVRYLLEVRQRRVVTGLFSLYVPAAVAEEILTSGLVEEVVAGQRVEVSTMFCDLRGFTALSAAHDPTEVREMLDHYYEFASEIVLRHGGTLMQYVGDEVFAVFGAPLADAAHSQHATDCAAELQTGRPRLTAVLEDHGLPPLTYGIGVNSGPVVAAHTGSSFRRQYTVIGDTVNTGSRLCSQAGRHAVVISDAVAQALTDAPEMEDMGPLAMKGVRDDFVAWRLRLPGVVAEDR